MLSFFVLLEAAAVTPAAAAVVVALTRGVTCTRVMVWPGTFEFEFGAWPLESTDVDSFCFVKTKLFLRMTKGRRLLPIDGMTKF